MKNISVQNMDGNSEQITLVSSFVIPEIDKKFAILSKGEAVGEGTAKLYIAEIFETGGACKFIGIIDEVVWDKVKQTMKTLVQGGTVTKYRYESVTPGILEGYRIIGLKNSDLESIAKNSEEAATGGVEDTIDEVVPSEENLSSAIAQTTDEIVKSDNLESEVPLPNLESNMSISADTPSFDADFSVSAGVDSEIQENDSVMLSSTPEDDDSLISDQTDDVEETDNFTFEKTTTGDSRFDSFLMETQKILEDTREKFSALLDEYDRRVMEVAIDYIDELESQKEKCEIENEAYRKAIGNVINNIKIDE